LSESKTKQEVTREKFARFLEWLSPDPDRAGEEYERLRFRLCTYFSHRHCGFADELADETINRVMLKLSEERIESKVAYCYGVAKNIYRETLRKQRSHVDLDDVVLPAGEPYEPSISSECLDKCLEDLPEENRKLLLDYFSGTTQQKVEHHRRISEGLKTTQTALRMRVMRYKQKLKICVQECLG
jgi:RNA polymerase sigma factor (sigma-70 family)